MNIQIDNTGFINKGAELMLNAIVSEFRDNSEVNFVFNGVATYKEKASLGLLSMVSLQRFRFNFHKIFPQNRFRNTGIEFIENINVLFDAGGFHIGDQWISDKTLKEDIDKKINYYKKYKKIGAKIIFLSQAAGPFEKELSKYYFKELFKLVDLFIARDKTSYEACKKVVGDDVKLKLFPDFTNLYSPQKPQRDLTYYENKVCLIPNSKMLTHTSKEKKLKYQLFLNTLLQECKRNNIDLFFLNHEGAGDMHIIEDLNKTFNLPVLSSLNANDVKYVIGKSKFVISSRFHGVVSGLCQNVPTFCTSWSHKYEELMNDYKMNGVIDFLNIDKSVSDIIHLLQKEDELNDIVENLKLKSSVEKEKTQQMWTLVKNTI